MTGKHRVSEASQNRRTHKPPHDNRGGRNLDKIEGPETSFQTASTSKKPKEEKPHKSPSSLKEDTPRCNTTDNRSTSVPKSLDESSHKLAFRSKGKELVNSDSGKGPSYSLGSEAGKDACNPPGVLLVVDLNSRNPTVAFIAPSLGFSEHKFLPAIKAMSKTREAFLTSTEFGLSSPQPSQSSSDWTTDFLSHCRALLRLEIARPLEDLILEFSFTARGDASDRSKAMLLGAVKAAGFKISTEDAIQIFSTVEAVTVETVRYHVTKSFDNQSPYPGGAPKADSNILVLHYDGDVAEIQSYSVSWEAATGKSAESRIRLEEITYGETVDCGKLVDYQFTRWIEECFENSVSNVSTNNIGTDGGLMAEFAEVRRNYKPGQKDRYTFPFTIQGASRNPHRHASQVQVQDSEMRGFFEPAMDSLLNSLDGHHARVGQKKKTIDEVIFAGATCIAPYVEDHLKDWGIGVGLLDTRIQAFVMPLRQYIRVEATPEMIVRGAIHGNYPGVEVVTRSRAHYGFQFSNPFEDGDPEWSRQEDHWDNIDKCKVRVSWKVQKDQLLDAHANVSQNIHQKLTTDAELSSRLDLYKCELDSPPRWVRTHQNISNPDMQFVGSVAVTFTEADFPDAEYKLCDDGLLLRDKIYGLVGLANDGADLVIDYSKSPLDLFVDLDFLGQRNGIRDNVIPFTRFLQRLFLGEVEIPPIDSPYSSRISVVAEVYEAGTMSYLEPTPDWNSVELKHHYNTETLQVMKLEACNPLTVMLISSNIAYAVKERKASQFAVKTDNGTSKVLTTKRPLEYVSPINGMNVKTFVRARSATSILKESEPLLFVDQMGYIGIAPRNARVLDTICRTENVGPNRSVVVILRMISNHYIVIGRAMFPIYKVVI